MRAVRQYLLAGSIVKRRDFFILPLLLIILLSALFYTRFNQWVLFLTLICLAAVFLLGYLFFLKPQRDYHKKPHLQGEIHLSFTEEGVIFPSGEPKSIPAETDTPIPPAEPEYPVFTPEEPALETNPETAGAGEAGAVPETTEAPEDAVAGEALPAPKADRQPGRERHVALPGRKRQKNQLNWDAFAEAWENREFFFLILQPNKYYIVPKRSFSNPEELQYFLKMLYRRVGIVESVAPYRGR